MDELLRKGKIVLLSILIPIVAIAILKGMGYEWVVWPVGLVAGVVFAIWVKIKIDRRQRQTAQFASQGVSAKDNRLMANAWPAAARNCGLEVVRPNRQGVDVAETPSLVSTEPHALGFKWMVRPVAGQDPQQIADAAGRIASALGVAEVHASIVRQVPVSVELILKTRDSLTAEQRMVW